MWWGMHDGWFGGWGWLWMGFGWLWMLAFWGGIVGIAVWAIRRLSGQPQGRPPERHDWPLEQARSPLEVAQTRYARGEISHDEYEEIHRTLSQ